MSVGLDGTTRRLVDRLEELEAAEKAAATGGAVPARGARLSAAQRRAAYLDVMGTPGVFAEELMLEFLSEALHGELHLYFCADAPAELELMERRASEDGERLSDSSAPSSPAVDGGGAHGSAWAPPPPTKIICGSAGGGAALACNGKGGGKPLSQPVRMLHKVGARHFDLLLPRGSAAAAACEAALAEADAAWCESSHELGGGGWRRA